MLTVLEGMYDQYSMPQDSWWSRNKNKVYGAAALTAALAGGAYIQRNHTQQGIMGSLAMNGKLANTQHKTQPTQQSVPKNPGEFVINKGGGILQAENVPKPQQIPEPKVIHTMNKGIVPNPQYNPRDNSGVVQSKTVPGYTQGYTPDPQLNPNDHLKHQQLSQSNVWKNPDTGQNIQHS